MTNEPNLPALDIGSRRERIEVSTETAEVEVLVLTTPSNIRWACGFTGSNGVLFVASDGWVLHTDSRYQTQAQQQLKGGGVEAKVLVGFDPWAEVAVRFENKRVGIEADHITWGRGKALAKELGETNLVGTTEVIETLRIHKEPGELARLQRAAQIADAALAMIIPELKVGVTEVQLARRLDDQLRDLGADRPGYDTIVAAGPNSALPHVTPGDRAFRAGDLLIIDVGAEVDGYRSDMTRSFVFGEPNKAQQRQFDVVMAAQQAGLDAVRPKATGFEIDRAARDVIAAAGWSDAFGHGTGHGVGIDIHELPRINTRAQDQVMSPGTVITVEPGVYLPGEGGVRWEDLVVVTENGCECLTHSPKNPILDI